MDIQIRHATTADASSIQAFLSELWAESLDAIYSRPAPHSLDEVEAFIKKIDETPNSASLVALTDGRVIGFLDLHGSGHEQMRHSVGFGIRIAESYRGLGVGKALMTEMLSYAKSIGWIKRIELQVFEGNAPAIRLYESFGFEEEGRRRSAAMIKGRPVDVILMSLMLE